jgi:hypothetical protein
MAIIQVKFDSTLKQSDIVIPLTNSSQDEAGDAYKNNQPEIQQTSVYGIQSPLIAINDIVVDFSDVIYFDLKCTDITPTVKLIVLDRSNLIKLIDTPGPDNQLRVQILPKFEDKYKKINLTFFITKTSISDKYITINGEYKSPKFISANIKSFGQISTYKLFETIAQETQLGFATNITDSDLDKRYIYSDNMSYNDLLDREIRKSGSENQILDYWIDWWNNLVLADVYERYNSIDKDSDMQIWVSGQNHEVSEGNEVQPQQVVANLNNSIADKFSELYVENYSILNSPGQQYYNGSDQLYTTYEIDKLNYSDYLVQDGDVQKDITTKFEYLGEVYGGYNYLLAGRKRDSFLQKMQTNETIEITLNTPLLGIMRGNRVNFTWYTNNSMDKNKLDAATEAGIIQDPLKVNTNIPMNYTENEEVNEMDGKFEIDKSISGQYLITKCNMKFEDSKWEYKITLKRPISDKPKIINEHE